MILAHYYHKDDFPFQSLLCLSEEEAFLLQPRLNPLLSAGLSLFECCVMSAIPNLHFNNAVVGSLQMLLAAFTGKSIGCYNVFNFGPYSGLKRCVPKLGRMTAIANKGCLE